VTRRTRFAICRSVHNTTPRVVCVVLHAGTALVATVFKDAVDGLDFRGAFIASTGTRRVTGRNAKEVTSEKLGVASSIYVRVL